MIVITGVFLCSQQEMQRLKWVLKNWSVVSLRISHPCLFGGMLLVIPLQASIKPAKWLYCTLKTTRSATPKAVQSASSIFPSCIVIGPLGNFSEKTVTLALSFHLYNRLSVRLMDASQLGVELYQRARFSYVHLITLQTKPSLKSSPLHLFDHY